ncbi:UxaA family hydrolase [Gilliamella sp. Gris1-4]|uniref:UxaA family hydrolase n=1 Tax=Gilliamella sp. Gris1-4 TaxID=3120244 RepID=UPI00080E053F|nr:altronate dehydratase family protein [Gilliamella apicola]OCG37550.1 altronate hydrolase [Gilliamella apicola]
MIKFIKINNKDNVGVALTDLEAHEANIVVDGHNIDLQQPIKQGHKFALKDFEQGENVIKYGLPIGHATCPIKVGEHIHSQNLKTNLSDINNYQYQPNLSKNDLLHEIPDKEVQIYRRKNGEVGIRNELWIIPTVTCINGIAQQIVKQFCEELNNQLEIDGITVLEHPYGCSQLGQDHNNTKIILQDLVKHPNAGAVLVIGLGCENNQILEFKADLGEYDESRVRFLVAQQELDEVESALSHLRELYAIMKNDKRELGRLSELKFGLECGGSDGFSGITANPMLGLFSDYIIAHGGTSVLTEVPEMFGAENILMSHCVDESTFDKTVHMINDFKQYFISNNQPIYENPSPGNKAGGSTTLEEKSLGCTQKAGGSKVIDVLNYGQMLTKHGLNLLSAPGNDAVATGALSAAGCHMVLFTTGRGTPYGGVVPTVKIATNSQLADKKVNWIDFNAGKLIQGVSMKSLLIEFIEHIVLIANGKKTCNEENNFRNLAILKSGVTL